jgi:hypothetical protein
VDGGVVVIVLVVVVVGGYDVGFTSLEMGL